MLDIGWQELLLIGALALIVVGPKELPRLLRTVGQWVGRARSMAREFQRSMDEAAREADVAEFRQLRDAKRELDGMTRLDYGEQAKRAQSFLDGGAGGSEGDASPGRPEAPKPAAPPPPASTPPAASSAPTGSAPASKADGA